MPVLFKGANGPVASIINAFSSGGTATAYSLSSNNVLEQLSGSLTADTLKTMVSHTGRGRVNALVIYTKDNTSRTLRCKLTVDGVVVFDATSNAVASPGFGMIVIGGAITNSVEFQPIDYQESLLVEIASSLTETDKVAIGVNRETWAS
ncbi:MAG TPA: hypothetical protein PKC59_02800 [Burkholderiaceae bacterium]|nr:hypothetical protein [Burkholderiaceae bacterium]